MRLHTFIKSILFSSPRLLEEDFHTFIKSILFSSPTNVGHHNPPPFGASVLAGTHSILQSMWDHYQIHPLWGQHPYWHTASCLPPFREQRKGWHIIRCLTLIPFVTTLNPPLADIVLFGLSLSGFPLRL